MNIKVKTLFVFCLILVSMLLFPPFSFCQTVFLPVCDSMRVLCPIGTSPSCETKQGKVECRQKTGSEDFIAGCNNESDFVDGGVICEFTSGVINTPNIFEILESPKIPEVINIPVSANGLQNIGGVAFPGSKPTYEIIFNTNNKNVKVTSVNLLDSKSTYFKSIPFNVIELTENENLINRLSYIIVNSTSNEKKIILTITLPKEVPAGDSTLIIELSDGNLLSGYLQIVNFLKVKVKKNRKFKNVLSPKISNVKANERELNLFLDIKGKNFLGKEFFQISNDATENIRFENSQTFLTILPQATTINELKISRDGTKIKAAISLESGIKTKTKLVLVVSTLRGIISFPFVIGKDKDNDIVCEKGEFICR